VNDDDDDDDDVDAIIPDARIVVDAPPTVRA